MSVDYEKYKKIILDDDFVNNLYCIIQLICAISHSNEDDLMVDIAELETLKDAYFLMLRALEEGEIGDDITLDADTTIIKDASDTDCAGTTQIKVLHKEKVIFKISFYNDKISVIGESYIISFHDDGGNGFDVEKIAKELSAMPHRAKQALHDVLLTFPCTDKNNDTIVEMISILDYRGVSAFPFGAELYSHMLSGLNIIDSLRGVDKEDKNSLSVAWRQCQAQHGVGMENKIAFTLLSEQDHALEIDFTCDENEDVISEAIFCYPLADGNALEVVINHVGVNVDTGFALFLAPDDAMFSTKGMGSFFIDASSDLYRETMLVVDNLAGLMTGHGEKKRLRLRRLLGSLPNNVDRVSSC